MGGDRDGVHNEPIGTFRVTSIQAQQVNGFSEHDLPAVAPSCSRSHARVWIHRLAATLGALSASCSLRLSSFSDYTSAFSTPDADADAASQNSDAEPVDDVADGGPMETDAEDASTAIEDADASTVADAPADASADAPASRATLQVYYAFDDAVGSAVAADSSGNHRDGMLFGTSPPAFGSAGHRNGSLRFDGTQQQYVQLPPNLFATFDSISVACWINVAQAQIWDRLFDFNAGNTIWMYFSPTGWNSNTMMAGTHFAISSGALLDPEMMLTETVSLRTWHHVAIVLDAPSFIYYLDGVEKSRMTNMTLAPRDLGVTTQNWLGRSSFAADPYLSATLDEFRVYSGPLSPEEVAALAR